MKQGKQGGGTGTMELGRGGEEGNRWQGIESGQTDVNEPNCNDVLGPMHHFWARPLTLSRQANIAVLRALSINDYALKNVTFKVRILVSDERKIKSIPRLGEASWLPQIKMRSELCAESLRKRRK